MTDDFKDEIRSRMGGDGQRYVYRSNGVESLVDEVRRGYVQGGTHRIIHGELAILPMEDPIGTEVDDLPWVPTRRQEDEVPVTGGVSSSLAQTRRFSGGGKYAVVLRAGQTPFSPIEYSYDWFNENPGAMSHIQSSSDGELWIEFDGGKRIGRGRKYGDLYGTFTTKPMVSGPRKTEVRNWKGTAPISGTNPGSTFADEQEWVTLSERADISGAVEGFVSVLEPLSVRVEYADGRDMIPGDAPAAEEILEDVYQSKAEPVPDDMPYYLLVVDDFRDFQNTGYEGWRPEDIRAAVVGGTRVDPADIPPQYRGKGGA